ncbi:MAG: hypothetical protein J6V66_04450 [Clostridia bacterium]|nr:hypothetical protein [Clostridia bacterium]
MDVIKIAIVGVVGALIFIYLKTNSSELSGLTAVATGILMLIMTIDYIFIAVDFFKNMATTSGIDSEVFKIIVKIIAISYLADFSSAICADLGVSSLAEKVNFASRIIIFVCAFPVITNLYQVVSSIIV